MHTALFNVDTQQPAETADRLVFRPRVEPFVGQLKRLLQLAEKRGMILVSTACVNAGPVETVLGDDVLFVPIDGKPADWHDRASDYRRFFLQKRGCGSRDLNIEHRVYDVFHNNPNAELLLARIGYPHWTVFGDSGAYCVATTVTGLLRLGYGVTLLVDAVGQGAATETEFRLAMREMEQSGATLSTVDQFMRTQV